MNFAIPLSAHTFVSAAVNVVFPWSTCPIVPMFTCGFFRSYFAFAMGHSLPLIHEPLFLDDGFRNILRHLIVPVKFHTVGCAPLRPRSKVSGIAEHLHQRHGGVDCLSAGP